MIRGKSRISTHRALRAATLGFCGILFFAMGSHAQTIPGDRARLRVETDLVTVPATVLDPNGKPVADLPESAFRLYQDGAPQTIAKFETQTNRPLELALMVDSSLSTIQDTKFEDQATARFIHLVVQPGDLLDVFEFSDYVYDLSSGFSANVAKLEAAAERIAPGAGTSLYDAIVLGSEQLEKLPEDRRRVIVLVTDAGETTSKSSFEAARRAAIASEGLLYTILIRAVPNEAGRNTGGEHAIETIIDSTGGAVYYPKSMTNLDTMFQQISRELRTQYLLSYYPQPKPKAGAYCRIELDIPSGSYTLHYRKGYFEAGPPQESASPNSNQ
ncbi:MAG TPA: VWA domain-containing protein [Candidatus Acidoferrales bacterium]|nr:VWA domain-containing protein [Candidatus Acidoferrales bacterium]